MRPPCVVHWTADKDKHIRNRFEDRIAVCSSANILRKHRLSWGNGFRFLAWDTLVQITHGRRQLRATAGEADCNGRRRHEA